MAADSPPTTDDKTAPASSIFGGAKPVDTAKKEKEIEEKLASQKPAKEEPPPQPKKPSAASIFGAAKPVDTTAKEREIEERLLKTKEDNEKVDEKDG